MSDETQTYAVGLPVVITVGETGVEYSVDFGDVREAIREDDSLYDPPLDESRIDRDADIAAAWLNGHSDGPGASQVRDLTADECESLGLPSDGRDGIYVVALAPRAESRG